MAKPSKVSQAKKKVNSCIVSKIKSMRAQGKIGQAPALTVRQWKLWLAWLLEKAGPRIYFAVMLTGALGLRISEALALKREDIRLDAPIPHIKVSGEVPGACKSPGEVYVRKQHFRLIKAHLKTGIHSERSIGHKHGKGRKRQVRKKDHFSIPRSGFLFLGRKGASQEHLHYQAVYAHVRRQAPMFHQHLTAIGEAVSLEICKIRTHTGRATLITELMGEGMVTAMSMKYARHSPGSCKVHLRYGRLSLQDVKAACDKLCNSRKISKWSKWSTRDLLKAQKAINKELAVRMK